MLQWSITGWMWTRRCRAESAWIPFRKTGICCSNYKGRHFSAALQHSGKSGQSNLKQIFMRKLLTQVKKKSHSEWMWGCICFWPVKALEIEIHQNNMHLIHYILSKSEPLLSYVTIFWLCATKILNGPFLSDSLPFWKQRWSTFYDRQTPMISWHSWQQIMRSRWISICFHVFIKLNMIWCWCGKKPQQWIWL